MSWLDNLDKATQTALLAEVNRRISETQLHDYQPYPKQAAFHEAGATYRERMLSGGNQVGKSLPISREVAMHATGIYPEWWRGKRFQEPVQWGVASETGLLTRDGIQKHLFGYPAFPLGTGAVPLEYIIDPVTGRGVKGLFDYVKVRHVPTGGESIIYLRSYDQGRERIQAMTLHGFSFDEEPDEDYYLEALTRTNKYMGPVTLSFTPLKGMSRVVKRFVLEKQSGSWFTKLSIREVPHFTEAEKTAIIASYPIHMRAARADGEPMLGEGAVFPIDEALVKFRLFPFPAHWPRIAAMDIGWTHPAAIVWMAWDRDADIVYVYDALRMKETPIPVLASGVRARGLWIPMAWPHDGENETAQGPQVAQQFRDEGINMRPENAKFPETTDNKQVSTRQSRVSVEAGVSEMLTRMINGQLKVADHLLLWFEEFRQYHREKGKIVKLDDDLLSATRYGIMDLRFAITQPVARKVNPNRDVNWRAL